MTSTNSTQEKVVDIDMKMQSIDLNAWFGPKQALKNINIRHQNQRGNSHYWSFRMRQIHLHPLPKPNA